jgi:hypothetical protein
MQFSGLYDRNWKKIYEGDIIRIKRGKGILFAIIEFESQRGFSPWYVKRIDPETMKEGQYLGTGWVEKDTEVTGNIYQNAGLLKII